VWNGWTAEWVARGPLASALPWMPFFLSLDGIGVVVDHQEFSRLVGSVMPWYNAVIAKELDIWIVNGTGLLGCAVYSLGCRRKKKVMHAISVAMGAYWPWS